MNPEKQVDKVVLERNRNRLRQALTIIETYNPNKPLNEFLRGFYNKHKNMGAADRRNLSSIIYQYFRLGKNFMDYDIVTKLGISTFLCNSERLSFFEFMIEEYSPFHTIQLTLPMDEKVKLVGMQYPDFKPEKLFPFTRYLSKIEEVNAFILSHLNQPRVWIRIREGRQDEVIQELKELAYLYDIASFSDDCFSFHKHYPLHECKTYLQGYFEIQDGGSQRTGNFMQPLPNEVWWDACAGSGGKSLMLLDKEPSISLFVTDIRKKIIENLVTRFEKVGITKYKAITADLSKRHPIDIPFEFFDGIILDVPCSGSGTWAATPELLTSFELDTIATHHSIQTAIAQHVLPYLKVGKPLIYITCSVYKQENEDVVKFLCDHFNMTLEESQIIDGFKYGASTFFVARLIKN